MLDCDTCHQPFLRAATATEHDEELAGMTWGDATNVLITWAFDAGWEAFRQFYICKDCIRDKDECDAIQITHLSARPQP